MGKDKLAGLNGIFFWSWLGDTADGNQLLVKLSEYTSCCVGKLGELLQFNDIRKTGLMAGAQQEHHEKP